VRVAACAAAARAAAVLALLFGLLPFAEGASRRIDILPAATITGAATVTSSSITVQAGLKYISAQATFTYGSGGTTCKAWLQTSLDGGTTWRDVAAFAFTTASAKKTSALSSSIALAAAVAVSDGALADDTLVNGLFGDLWRIKVTSTGTYAGGTTIAVWMVPQQ
jgi:hypothetical protein